MSEDRSRLNEALRGMGYDVRGDLVIARPDWSETREVRAAHEVVMAASTDIGEAFDPEGARCARFLENPVVLWNHDYAGLPVGRAYFTNARIVVEKQPTLSSKLNFHRDTELSCEAWKLAKDVNYVVWQLGVIPVEWDYGTTGLLVTKWNVVEISAVPSTAGAAVIHRRIKDRKITSPAMLRSVEGTEPEAEPEPALERCDDPYTAKLRVDKAGSDWFVYGLGIERAVATESDARARVVELNDAWRRGRESAAVRDAPEPVGAAPYRWQYEAFAEIGKGARCVVSGPGVEEQVESKADAERWVTTLNRVRMSGQGSVTDEPTPDGLTERVAELERWRAMMSNKLARIREQFKRDTVAVRR